MKTISYRELQERDNFPKMENSRALAVSILVGLMIVVAILM